MEGEQAKSIVSRFIEEIDRCGSPPRELAADDFRAHFPGSPNLTFDEYSAMTQGVYAVLEGMRHDVEVIVSEGDYVFYRSTNSGRHTGELLGAAATGRDVTVTSMAQFRLNGARIAEVWVEMDTIGLMRQVGAIAE